MKEPSGKSPDIGEHTHCKRHVLVVETTKHIFQRFMK